GIPNGPEAPAAKEVPTASGSTAGAPGIAEGSRRLPAARPAAPGGTAGGSRRHGRRLPAARPAAPGGTAGGSRRHGRRLPAARPAPRGGEPVPPGNTAGRLQRDGGVEGNQPPSPFTRPATVPRR